MSHTLTQPEEIDLAMMELENLDQRERASAAGKKSSQQTSPPIPNYGYISPYRAAHIRSMHSRSNPQL